MIDQKFDYKKLKNFQAKTLLESLTKLYPIKRALDSALGQELLNEALLKCSALLEKIIQDKASSNEKADFRAYRNIIISWSKKIEAYDKMASEINKRAEV